MKNEMLVIDEENIKEKIYVIRGKEVMLDSDLAKLYNVETKRINEAVKNNPKKFPERFSWKLSGDEEINLRSKFSTSSLRNNYGGKRYNSRVFTEQGVAMLATILKSKTATKTSIKIMDAFVAMRHVILDNINYQKELFLLQNKILEHDNKLIDHDKKINTLFNKFSTEDIFKDKMIFKGELYDGYSLILDILNKAKNEIIIIDNYANKEVLDLICKLDIKVIVVSANMDNESINKYKKQYNNLTIINNDSFHDRFIIIDKEIGYHLGSSIKDIGRKISFIGNIDKRLVHLLLNEISIYLR